MWFVVGDVSVQLCPGLCTRVCMRKGCLVGVVRALSLRSAPPLPPETKTEQTRGKPPSPLDALVHQLLDLVQEGQHGRLGAVELQV